MKEYSLLISQKQLNDRTPLNDNLDFSYVLPHLIAAQDLGLVPVLGQALMDFLMVSVKDDTVTPDQEVLLDDYITPYLAYETLVVALPSLSIKLVDSGVVQRIADDSNPLSLEEIDKLIGNYTLRRDDYKQRLIDYLCANNSLYPQFKESKYWEIAPSSGNYDFGIGLTGVGDLPSRGGSDGGASTKNRFIDLTDTPSSYAGAGLKAVQVKATEDGLEFVIGGGGGGGTYEIEIPSHGFSLNQFLHYSGVWELADAASTKPADVVIIEVVSVDKIIVAFSGIFPKTGLVDSDVYYLDSAGGFTNTKPANNIQILFRASTAAYVLYIGDMTVYGLSTSDRTVDIPIGVQSVTGDGVDNTDPDNPIMSYPTPEDIGALESVIPGANMEVDNSDANNPVIIGKSFTDSLTTAQILALDPETTPGVYWSTDDFAPYYPIKAADSLNGLSYWKRVDIKYNASTDSYKVSTTEDGQVQDLGQEIWFSAKNTTVTSVTAASPKVFKAVGSDVNEAFKEVVFASADNIKEGNLIGFNTTEALADGFTKILTFGDLNDVDTSLWAKNTILYLTTNGNVTDIKPSTNAWAVAAVMKQDALTGIMFVNTIGIDREDIAIVPSGAERRWFTGDVIAVNAVDFYDTDEAKGTVASIQQQVVVADDTKVAYSQDWISKQNMIQHDIPLTSYNAKLEVIMTQAGASGGSEQFYIEVYLADSLGAVVDSGSGLPNGDLGVPPITTLISPTVSMAEGVTTFIDLNGIVNVPVTVLVGQYVRYHVLGEKIGTQGGDKTLTIFAGINHNSFIDIPQQFTSDDILNDSTVQGNTVTDALNNVIPISAGLVEDTTHPSLSARTYETLTRAEYDAIVTKDPTQLYFTPKA